MSSNNGRQELHGQVMDYNEEATVTAGLSK
jgi:hypothetical protein